MELVLQILQAIVLVLTGFYVAMLIGDKRYERQLRRDTPDPDRYVDVVPSAIQFGD